MLGTGLVLWITAIHGPGFSPDSAAYLSCAESLLAGQGFLRYDGNMYVGWPPLFPLIISLLGKMGLNLVQGVRFFNALSFGLTITCFYYLCTLRFQTRLWIVAATVSLLCTGSMIGASIMVWSEPFFALLVLLFMIACQKYLDAPRLSTLMIASFVAALAALQRYAGFSLVIAAIPILMIYPGNHTVSKKLRTSTAFFLLSSLPYFGWMARNYMVQSVFSDNRTPSSLGFVHYMEQSAHVISGWLLPSSLPVHLSLSLSIPLLIAFFAMLIMARTGFHLPSIRILPEKWNISWTLSLISLVYVVIIICVSTVTSLDFKSTRYFTPLYFALIYLIFLLVEDVSLHWKNTLKNGWWVQFGLGCMVVMWMSYWSCNMLLDLSIISTEGCQGFTAGSPRVIQSTPTIQWIRDNPQEMVTYSTHPAMLYSYCDNLRTKMIPKRNGTILGFTEDIINNGGGRLVWLASGDLSSYYTFRELARICHMEVVSLHPEGIVFRLSPPKGLAAQTIPLEMGIIHLDKGELDQAEYYLEKAVEYQPDSIPAVYNLSCVYALKRDVNQAVACLQKAVDIGFEDWNYLDNDQDFLPVRYEQAFITFTQKIRQNEDPLKPKAKA